MSEHLKNIKNDLCRSVKAQSVSPRTYTWTELECNMILYILSQDKKKTTTMHKLLTQIVLVSCFIFLLTSLLACAEFQSSPPLISATSVLAVCIKFGACCHCFVTEINSGQWNSVKKS